MSGRKPILVLDFDGVLHRYGKGWEGLGVVNDGPTEGMERFLREAVRYFDVQVFSSRSCHEDGIEAMRVWLRRYLHPKTFEAIGWPKKKPAAFLSIDDRAMQFTGVWPDVRGLLEFKPWNK